MEYLLLGGEKENADVKKTKMEYADALFYETYYLNSNYLYHGLIDLLIDDINFEEPKDKLLSNTYWLR